MKNSKYYYVCLDCHDIKGIDVKTGVLIPFNSYTRSEAIGHGERFNHNVAQVDAKSNVVIAVRPYHPAARKFVKTSKPHQFTQEQWSNYDD